MCVDVCNTWLENLNSTKIDTQSPLYISNIAFSLILYTKVHNRHCNKILFVQKSDLHLFLFWLPAVIQACLLWYQMDKMDGLVSLLCPAALPACQVISEDHTHLYIPFYVCAQPVNFLLAHRLASIKEVGRP